MLQKKFNILKDCDRDRTQLQKRNKSKKFSTTHCDRQSTNFISSVTADGLGNKFPPDLGMMRSSFFQPTRIHIFTIKLSPINFI